MVQEKLSGAATWDLDGLIFTLSGVDPKPSTEWGPQGALGLHRDYIGGCIRACNEKLRVQTEDYVACRVCRNSHTGSTRELSESDTPCTSYRTSDVLSSVPQELFTGTNTTTPSHFEMCCAKLMASTPAFRFGLIPLRFPGKFSNLHCVSSTHVLILP